MKSLSISLVMALAGATMGFAGTTVWSVDRVTKFSLQDGAMSIVSQVVLRLHWILLPITWNFRRI